jgi:hypothetical protein
MRVGSVAWRGFGFFTQFAVLIGTVTALQGGCGGSDAPSPGTGGGKNTGGSDPDGSVSGGADGSGGKSSTGGRGSGGATGNGGDTDAGSGGETGDGGEPGSGGSDGSGGSAETGGSGGGSTDPTCNQKIVDPTKYPACTGCTGGHCVPNDFLETGTENLTACDSTSVCLPDAIIEAEGHYAPKKCTSILGNEGRCASTCLPAAAALAAVLPQDVCAASERCAPCYNPNDGKPTGVCNFSSCDEGPTTPAKKFVPCCAGRGTCIPRSAVPGNAAKNIAEETCKDDTVCAPSVIVNDPTYRFPKCKAVIFVGFPVEVEGDAVCVPKCIVDATEVGSYLTAGDCEDDTDKCVPCTDPRDNSPSGACL